MTVWLKWQNGVNLPKQGRDCNALKPMKQNITASEMGKIGGSRKSAAKTKAARENAKKPRNKKNVQSVPPSERKLTNENK